MQRGSFGKLGLLSALYFAEGLPFGFQAKALPIYLRESGVSLTAIALIGALSAPWLAKALWAPLVDRFGSDRFGRRKSWIIPMQLLLAVSCLVASMLSPDDDLQLLLGLVFLMNLFAATQDIAVDGLAVDLLGKDELGPGNAVQVVGYKLGMLTSGGLLVALSDSIGWSGLFLAMAALVAITASICLLYPEPHSGLAAAGGPTFRQVMGALWRSIRLPGGLVLLAVVATYKLGETMGDVLMGPFLIDAGFGKAQIGLWLGSYGLVFSLVGSAAGGALAARISFIRAVAVTAALRVIPLVGQWMLALGDPGTTETIVVICTESFFGGALTTAMFALMMSRVDHRIGATHFTLLASIEVLGKTPSGLASGVFADATSYAAVFGAGALISVAFLFLLPALREPSSHATLT